MTRKQQRYSRRGFFQTLTGHGMAAKPVSSPVTYDDPVITHTGRFYRQPGRLGQPPQIDRFTWQLVIDGLVARPLTLAYDDLLDRPAVGDMRTLVNDRIQPGGEEIGNAVWRGCRLSHLLDETGILDTALAVRFEAADGYGITLPLDYVLAQDVLLAWSMNGAQLPLAHGFPVRVLVPGLYGMASVRWLTRITLLDLADASYELPVVRTFARIMTPQPYDSVSLNTPIAVQGIAFAGLRKIARMELSIDGGPWTPVTLRPPDSPYAWTQWYTLWTPELAGGVTLAVRATDDRGVVQALDSIQTLALEVVASHQLLTGGGVPGRCFWLE